MHALMARTRRSTAAVTLSSLAVAGAIMGCPGASWSAVGPAVTVRVSVNSGEDERFKESDSPTISSTGRYVAFTSSARLVPADTNNAPDVYLRDRGTGLTKRVSVSSAGVQSNFSSSNPSVTPDGRYVAFQSYANNFWPGDTNNTTDIFVRDMVNGTTELVSLTSEGITTPGVGDGSAMPSISADGRYVAFESPSPWMVDGDFNNTTDVFVRDRTAGTTERVSLTTAGGEGSQASGESGFAISADGRNVVFNSLAPDLVADDTNNSYDVFVHDRSLDTTKRVSVSSAGAQADLGSGPVAISGNGLYVSFASPATNLVTGDTNDMTDVFVRDLAAGVTTLVSVATNGTQGNSGSTFPSLSYSGRYVAFTSSASTLAPGDNNLEAADVFVRDRIAETTRRVSVGPGGAEGNSSSGNSGPAISSNGQHVAFDSLATNLVTNDTNRVADVFVRLRFAS